MKIAELLVGQNYLRETDQIEGMIKFVRGGGFWTMEAIQTFVKETGVGDAKPIYITRFEDGQHFIHDGHHRIVATFLGGRDELREDEYRLKDWTYADYLKVDFEHGFVTPFDVKTECRIPDFCAWKDKVLAMRREGSEGLAMDEIKAGSHNYAEPRINTAIRQLAAEYQRLHKPKPKGVIRAAGVVRTAASFEAGQQTANDAHLQKITALMQQRTGRVLDQRQIEVAGEVIADAMEGSVDSTTVPIGKEQDDSPLPKPPVGHKDTLRQIGDEIAKASEESKSLTKKRGKNKKKKPTTPPDVGPVAE